MRVKFKNTEICVSNLKTGMVVEWGEFGSHYGNILAFHIEKPFVFITVSIGHSRHVTLKSSEITWINPD